MNWKKRFTHGLYILPLVVGSGVTIMAKYYGQLKTPLVGAAFGTTTAAAGGLSWLVSILLGLVSVIVIFLLILYFQKHH